MRSLTPRVFANCTSLESVALPEGLVVIPDRAFSRCTALEEIRVAGSESAWAALTGELELYMPAEARVRCER